MNFRETDKLVEFIEKEIKGLIINDDDFMAGKWLSNVLQLLDFPRTQRHLRNGSYQAADMISNILIKK